MQCRPVRYLTSLPLRTRARLLVIFLDVTPADRDLGLGLELAIRGPRALNLGYRFGAIMLNHADDDGRTAPIPASGPINVRHRTDVRDLAGAVCGLSPSMQAEFAPKSCQPAS